MLAEGKTKRIESVSAVRLHIKDDITAGDGRRHDVLPGKGEFSCRTICNNFELLRACGIPVAYWGKDSPTSFIAPMCTMLKWEVVVRFEAHGSYLERNPSVKKGSKLETPLVEFYLKTAGRRWGEHDLPCDDPLALLWDDGFVYLYHPHAEFHADQFFLKLEEREAFTFAHEFDLLQRGGATATLAGEFLRTALRLVGRKLVDIKFEFGLDTEGKLLLADDVDNGSWRVLDSAGNYVDKQGYRDGDSPGIVLKRYEHVAALTSCFREESFQEAVLNLYRTGGVPL